MPSKLKRLIAVILVLSLTASLTAGCNITTTGSDAPIIQVPSQPQAVTTPSAGQNVVDEAWQIIFREYVENDKINAANMTAGAIKGMLEALNDPYTSYLDAPTYQLSHQDLQGKFEGIGAYVGIRDGQLIIIAPMPNSPAARAGIVAGDAILEVEGASTSEMSLEEAVLHIRGPKGTPVKLLIRHQDKPVPETIEIVRDSINVASVTYEMKGDIGYIHIYQFVSTTDGELTTALKDVISKGATGLILDLRYNPGGLVDTVVAVASHFIKSGVVLYVVDNKGQKDTDSVRPTSVTTDLPIVALSNNFSASGSEVLMGALQDHGRATIAGTTTFGKGSVDTFYQLKDGSGLYITIARWLTPNGRLIEGKGIDPDIQLTLTGDNATAWAIDYLHENAK